MMTNLHDAFKGQSRSLNTVPFHLLGIVEAGYDLGDVRGHGQAIVNLYARS